MRWFSEALSLFIHYSLFIQSELFISAVIQRKGDTETILKENSVKGFVDVF